MSSIDINTALGQFRVRLPILTSLPATVPSGAEFYYNGTKWRGLGAGESTLPEGTPWPVKGYKEDVYKVIETTVSVINKDSDLPTLAFTKDGTGTYQYSGAMIPQNAIVTFLPDFPDVYFTDVHYVQFTKGFERFFAYVDNVLTDDIFHGYITIRQYPPQP